MSTASLPYVDQPVPVIRQNMKTRILDHFLSRPIGHVFSSAKLHGEYGSAFRSRVSDINRDPSMHIRIVNETKVKKNREVSYYWAELR